MARHYNPKIEKAIAGDRRTLQHGLPGSKPIRKGSSASNSEQRQHGDPDGAFGAHADQRPDGSQPTYRDLPDIHIPDYYPKPQKRSGPTM